MITVKMTGCLNIHSKYSWQNNVVSFQKQWALTHTMLPHLNEPWYLMGPEAAWGILAVEKWDIPPCYDSFIICPFNARGLLTA